MKLFIRPDAIRAICVGAGCSLAIVLALMLSGRAVSQDQASPVTNNNVARLEYELGVLKRKQNLLGKNHPQREEIDQRISAVTAELDGENLGKTSSKASGSELGRGGGPSGVSQLSNAEMVAVLKSMAQRIERLEARVRRLEQAE